MRPEDTIMTDVELAERSIAADVPLQLDEAAFRLFYDATSRPLWSYLLRLSGDSSSADDLLQETYYRFLRTASVPTDEAHRRHYLFRIATNLAADRFRRRASTATVATSFDTVAASRGSVDDQLDVMRTMGRLGRRERALLWLAYVHGSSHAEIAGVLGLKAGSVKTLLFRARRRFLGYLGARKEGA
jgi:RNA polymerase sigma-70 factor (ECF subfamily)